MLERATAFRADVVHGRFVIETRFHGRKWEWLSNPTKWSIFLVVVTAYGVET